MFKSHSAGIGDLLRSSAAWRVLKNAYPGAELHLLFFTLEPGYPSEELIREHHLLDSFAVVDKRTNGFSDWRRLLRDVDRTVGHLRADLIVDFEPNGLRTSIVAARLGWRWGARTVGISTAPGRGLFYKRASVSLRKYARERSLAWPMDVAERDFVALTALGLERNGCPIEMSETQAGRTARLAMLRENGLSESTPLLGLNIGCGTPGAGEKKPNLTMLSELVAGMQEQYGLRLVLTGAPFERETNREFIEIHRKRSREPVIDTAGKTSISGLTGIINACRIFVSSDSGPYHMAVALRKPTLCIFHIPQTPSFHFHPWVRCLVATTPKAVPALRQAAAELMAWQAASAGSTNGFENQPSPRKI